MNINNPLWIIAVVGIFVLIIMNGAIAVKISESKKEVNEKTVATKEYRSSGKTETGERCPDASGGQEEAFLQVKYFYSDYCAWCKREEPILQRLAENYGDLIHISWYNLNDCPELVEKYKVSGVPTFVFSTTDDAAEYSHYGFIYETDLTGLMCDVTGGC